jgi:peptidyl-prolyl cis-trans isomerase SurA
MRASRAELQPEHHCDGRLPQADRLLAGNSLKRQIKGELAWQRLLRRNVSPFINVSDDEVNELLERLKAAKGTDEYRIGEIYLAAPPEARSRYTTMRVKIVEQLAPGRQLRRLCAAVFAGLDRGGRRRSRLDPAGAASCRTGDAARQMQPGQLVGPIELPGGFSIIYMIDKRQVLMADPRDAVLSLKQVSIRFPQGHDRGPGHQARRRIRKGNADGARLRRGRRGRRPDRRASRRQRSGPRARPARPASERGTQPRDRRDLAAVRLDRRRRARAHDVRPRRSAERAGPSFDHLMGQMEEDRINKRAQMYLRDLRRDAIIEYN